MDNDRIKPPGRRYDCKPRRKFPVGLNDWLGGHVHCQGLTPFPPDHGTWHLCLMLRFNLQD